jgi:hypothetical protein
VRGSHVPCAHRAHVYGATDPKKKILKPQTLIEGGVMAAECGAILTEFFSARR